MPRLQLFLLLGFLMLVPLGGGLEKKGRELTRFYSVWYESADAPPFGLFYVLDARQEGPDVRVRYIRLGPMGGRCEGVVTMKALESKVVNATLQALVGTNLCRWEQADIDRTTEPFPTKKRPFGSSSLTIVTQCGGRQRVLRFPDAAKVRMDEFKREYPEVDELWEFPFKLEKRLWPDSYRLLETWNASADLEAQRLGEEAAGEFRAGAFDAGFALPACSKDYRRGSNDDLPCLNPGGTVGDALLEGYLPRARVAETSTLLDADQLRFLDFAPPAYSPMARMAWIQGTVELALAIDPASGAVTRAEVVSGHPMLRDATLKAAEKWRFDVAATAPKSPVKVRLDFRLACPKASSQVH